MRRRSLATASAILLGALAGPADAQRTAATCNRYSVSPPSFANAGFNEILPQGERRKLLGNAFVIHAEWTGQVCNAANRTGPCEVVTVRAQPGEEWRVWNTVMVTAAHVLDEVCRMESSRVRLTMLPATSQDEVERYRAPAEIPIGAEWCARLRREDGSSENRAGQTLPLDMAVFSVAVPIPTRAAVRPYLLDAMPTDKKVRVAGFVPEPTQDMPGEAAGARNRTLLSDNQAEGLWDQETTDVTIENRSIHPYRAIKGAAVYRGMSGSPVVLQEDPYNVAVGVLTDASYVRSCRQTIDRVQRAERNAQRARGASPAEEPGDTPEDTVRDLQDQLTLCHDNADAIRNALVQGQTALMLPLLVSYKRLRLNDIESDRADPSVDAAVELYKQVRTSRQTGDDDPERKALKQSFLRLIQALTAMDQVRFWRQVQGDERRNVDEFPLLSDTCLRQ